MGNSMDKILPGLYVGNIRDAQNKQKLDDHGITHVLAIHDTARKIHEDKTYLLIEASDNARQELSQFFRQAIDFIHQARLDGGTVLVHCLAGVSRSVTVTVAYIMTSTDLGWRDALNAVRGARRCANPNYGFQKQLTEFESVTLDKERGRFNQKFPNNPFYESDIKKCRQLLVIHRDWVVHGDKPQQADYPLPHNAYKQNPTLDKIEEKMRPGSSQESPRLLEKLERSMKSASSGQTWSGQNMDGGKSQNPPNSENLDQNMKRDQNWANQRVTSSDNKVNTTTRPKGVVFSDHDIPVDRLSLEADDAYNDNFDNVALTPRLNFDSSSADSLNANQSEVDQFFEMK
ncbi:unnamed protein product [Owenia fusiformis]|uniref:Dual specificity protein phosphatase 15 n=1 Tax=Owenia fusiformis TaxID=6347 RepID=A0A8J1XTN6_OWEFU|nr:unnamed protein product [Owenia fusiformis]